MSEQPSMDDQMREVLDRAAEQQAQIVEIMNNLAAIADVTAVFSEPVQSGQYTVITASENAAGMGFGSGLGGGTGTMSDAEEQANQGLGFGGGSGGGGGAQSRPVAAIIIGPDGVKVEPIVDVTKFMIAFFTTVGSMAVMLGRIGKKNRR